MKKILLTLMFAAAIISCGGNKNDKENDATCNNINKENDATCINLNTDEFLNRVADFNQEEWKYKGDKPAIVDFYADWCGPCQKQGPILEKIVKKYAGQIYVYKVNTDYNPDVSYAYVKDGIPTLMFIPMTGDPTINVGLMQQEEVEKAVEEILLK